LADCEAASFRQTGPHRLSIRFRDGLVADLDFADYGKSGGPLKRALNDPALFARAYLDHGILTWPHGYDIAPETLRRYAEAGSLDL
jgi:hypothetical protein